VDEIVVKHKEAGDDYSYIMVEAIADRLAEAFAEKLHELVRREVWGYAADEDMSVDDMLKVKYQVSGLGLARPRGGACWRCWVWGGV
jgi:5-methyltetrahydrofolate--homocysteine methyltransferase